MYAALSGHHRVTGFVNAVCILQPNGSMEMLYDHDLSRMSLFTLADHTIGNRTRGKRMPFGCVSTSDNVALCDLAQEQALDRIRNICRFGRYSNAHKCFNNVPQDASDKAACGFGTADLVTSVRECLSNRRGRASCCETQGSDVDVSVARENCWGPGLSAGSKQASGCRAA
jgi:hypothetical protein